MPSALAYIIKQYMTIAIIGGGAAGFFAAISAKMHHPNSEVIIYEKSKKLLAKVKISGGGRCNVTNNNSSLKELSQSYPRGRAYMKKALKIFSTGDIKEWFESRDILLKAEADGRVFPITDDSQTIIDALIQETKKLGIKIQIGKQVNVLTSNENGIELTFRDELSCVFDKVIIATGGSRNRSGLNWLEDLGHKVEEPVPSLFTFNLPKNPIVKLMGVVADDVMVSIQGTRHKSSGPLLITHWGMSGPAILRLSAFAARILHDMNYDFTIQVNWVNIPNQNQVKLDLQSIIQRNEKKKLSNIKPFGLGERLWLFLLNKK